MSSRLQQEVIRECKLTCQLEIWPDLVCYMPEQLPSYTLPLKILLDPEQSYMIVLHASPCTIALCARPRNIGCLQGLSAGFLPRPEVHTFSQRFSMACLPPLPLMKASKSSSLPDRWSRSNPRASSPGRRRVTTALRSRLAMIVPQRLLRIR